MFQWRLSHGVIVYLEVQLGYLHSGTTQKTFSQTTEYTELQPLLSGVHSVMRVKSVLADEGGVCTPTPSHYIYPHQ
jgi:hypothetical protein